MSSDLQRGRAGRGRQVPAKLRLVEGTERDGPGTPPKSGGGIGQCPAGETAAVRRAWRVLRKEVGWLSQSSDRRALLLLARTLADLDTARGRVLEDGVMVETKTGEVESAWA